LIRHPFVNPGRTSNHTHSMTQLLDPTPTATADNSFSRFTDEHLMAMIQSRNPHGLGLLHDRFARLVKGISMKVLHNDADAEDLVQDVFLQIWNQASSYDALKGRPFSWIATLTRRRSIDRLRKRSTYGRAEDRLIEEKKGHSDTWTHVYEDVALVEISKHLRWAMSLLPRAQRNAVTLAYQKQMSQREIAARTGIPLGTIKTRLELGLKKMAVSLRGLEELLDPAKTPSAGRI